MINKYVLCSLIGLTTNVVMANEISYVKSDNNFQFTEYSLKSNSVKDAYLDYFISKPESAGSFPIVILVGGSTDKEHLDSIIGFQKYFKSELNTNHLGTLAVDKIGINNQVVNKDLTMQHYTRTQILNDYQQVISYVKNNPPKGWNGKFAILGVSEGGPIAEKLAEQNKDIQAVAIWSGAIDSSWRDTLWLDMHKIYNEVCVPQNNPISDCLDVALKDRFESRINYIESNPSYESSFFNMTNMYVADGVNFPRPDYSKLANRNVLVVTGVEDTIINSSDEFDKKAKDNKVKIDYWRVDGMDHMIRKRPDLIANTFVWLRDKLSK